MCNVVYSLRQGGGKLTTSHCNWKQIGQIRVNLISIWASFTPESPLYSCFCQTLLKRKLNKGMKIDCKTLYIDSTQGYNYIRLKIKRLNAQFNNLPSKTRIHLSNSKINLFPFKHLMDPFFSFFWRQLLDKQILTLTAILINVVSKKVIPGIMIMVPLTM